jgi:hypothetical protein
MMGSDAGYEAAAGGDEVPRSDDNSNPRHFTEQLNTYVKPGRMGKAGREEIAH